MEDDPFRYPKDENPEGNKRRATRLSTFNNSEERNGAEKTGKETEPVQQPEQGKDLEEPEVTVADNDSRIDVNIIWPPKIYADTVLEAYNIFQKTMHVFFRYPIFLRRDPDDGEYVLKYKQCSLFSFAFAVTSILLFILAVLITNSDQWNCSSFNGISSRSSLSSVVWFMPVWVTSSSLGNDMFLLLITPSGSKPWN
ncbi:unnamed protein product [Allacma fusca]|uniref:Uncharacterized protein n=1 Tax=Allacma fusca TaxID=39272 RepID=A0A8J2K3J4_9HEXA|nr:unnamed protein product [Allacma fusca]